MKYLFFFQYVNFEIFFKNVGLSSKIDDAKTYL